jgi:hypothetical protein
LNISTWHSVALSLVLGHSGVRGDEIADDIVREGTVHLFLGLERTLGVSRQNIRKIYKMLDGQPAFGNVAGFYQYSEASSKIDFGP